MMNLLFSRKVSTLLPQNYQFSFSSTRVVLDSLLFSTNTPTKPLSSSNSSKLYRRIEVIRDPRVSILPVLDQWVKEGNTVEKDQLVSLIRIMKGYKRFNHALEVSKWMTGRRFFTLTTDDAAIRLALIHRVHGLEEAENYFNNLSVKLKTKYTYGAILNGCVREKSVQKAEAFMQEMREGGMMTSFPYNVLINLYSQTGDFDKIPPLVKEMERNGIARDQYTMRNLIAAFVAASDISGVERILKLMEENPELGLNWKVYTMAADAYLKIGSIETALTMLKKLEKLMTHRRVKSAFNFLLSLYAKTGDRDELYRIWSLYKPSSESMDTSYFNMIESLSKLDDIEGAEKIFEEWESQCTMYDFRVLNRLLVAYCKRGLFEKAEAAIEKAAQGRTPHASTWNVMAMEYMEHDQMSKAVEMLKRAIFVARGGWKPDPILVSTCLEYLEGLGDAEETKEFTRLLKNSEL